MHEIIALVLGKDVEVEYEDGSGDAAKVKGKLISTDSLTALNKYFFVVTLSKSFSSSIY